MPSLFFTKSSARRNRSEENVWCMESCIESRGIATHESMKYFRNLRHNAYTRYTSIIAYVLGYYYTITYCVVTLLR